MAQIKDLKKFYVQQHGHSDCGPACLLSIIRYYGGNTNLDQIRRVTGTSKTGTKMLGLFQGAKELGFEPSGLEAESIEDLNELNQPAILHVVLKNNKHHYVVFFGFDNDEMLIGDPNKGLEKWSKERLKKVWKEK